MISNIEYALLIFSLTWLSKITQPKSLKVLTFSNTLPFIVYGMLPVLLSGFLWSEWLQGHQDSTGTDDIIVPSTVLCCYLCHFVYVIQFPVWQSVFEYFSVWRVKYRMALQSGLGLGLGLVSLGLGIALLAAEPAAQSWWYRLDGTVATTFFGGLMP